MRNTKANIGSLSSMASKVRQEKKNGAAAKAKAPLAHVREPKKPLKGAGTAGTADDSSSDSDSSTSGASDSDGDDDLDAARAKFLASKVAKQNKAAGAKVNGAKAIATPAKPLTKGSIPSSAQKSTGSSDSGSKSGSDGSASSKLVANKSKVSASKEKSSSESTSSSGGSSDSESEEEAKVQKKKVNGKASASDDSEESESSSSDEDAPSTAAQANSKGNEKGTVGTVEESSSEESESESESDDDGDGGGGGGKMSVARINGEASPKQSMSQISQAQWLNNSDFTLRKASSSNPGKEVADFFSSANLEGKQVWYFTAPASLPITVLKDMEIDLSKATKGESLLTHKGDNYGLDLESYATSTQIQLLIPSQGGDKYASLNRSIDSTVHLRRMAKFGPGGEVHATATDDYVPVPKPIREQPEGLRVRYTPIGVPSMIPGVAPIRKPGIETSSSQINAKARKDVSSSSESTSESDSDVEVRAPPEPTAPASKTKSARSGITNGDRKRKHSGDQDKTIKRVKTELPAAISSVRSTPIEPPTSSSAVPDPTPSKKPPTKAKDNKKRKTEKTPKSTTVPTTAKQTPIPLPTYPGMKR